jgi:hypothetical protein
MRVVVWRIKEWDSSWVWPVPWRACSEFVMINLKVVQLQTLLRQGDFS